ncbi:hypothetical protein HII31_03923 [Pseudocercospora fuligena]|uniref:Uncharacterized protein n=1 Tax=Pseudocercospora fuligena TaxID=685502 RepID=A0A8H6RR08_9PEZI|nr:hypothetical protein HII31_03923 [Pseudocercospora fuligena]
MARQASAAPVADITEDFNTRLLNLPQELFDNIFEHVTAVDSNKVIEIGDNHKPPKELQLTQIIRFQQAAIYYRTNKFFAIEGSLVLSKWLASVPEEQRVLIAEVRVPLWERCVGWTAWERSRLSDSQYRRRVARKTCDVLRHIISRCLSLSGDCFKTDYMDENGDMVWLTLVEVYQLLRRV